MRPFQSWPIWMLQAIVRYRRRKTMWAEAYFELVQRGNDYAEEYAKSSHGRAWAVGAPPGMH